MKKHLCLFAVLGWAVLSLSAVSAFAQEGKLRVLLIDGQNNHNWRATTPVLKRGLEASGRFTVDVATTPEKPAAPKKGEPKPSDADRKATEAAYRKKMEAFQPDLSKYDVVVSNYNGDSWGKEFNANLESSLKSGKLGLVIVHAANNAFGGWKEYNLMIGMGWRGPKGGDRLYLDDAGKSVKVEMGKGDGSGHRYTGKFAVTIRDAEHPVTKGMPREWMHNNDELYDNMRGPIENVHLLATASAPAGKGTKVHEPMIWTVSYGKGRVFHTPMGHDVNAMLCVGFTTTLARGTEWAATGNVTTPVPANFPTAGKVVTVPAK